MDVNYLGSDSPLTLAIDLAVARQREWDRQLEWRLHRYFNSRAIDDTTYIDGGSCEQVVLWRMPRKQIWWRLTTPRYLDSFDLLRAFIPRGYRVVTFMQIDDGWIAELNHTMQGRVSVRGGLALHTFAAAVCHARNRNEIETHFKR